MSKNLVLALGFFDGVHLGHAALLRRAAAVAQAQGQAGGLTPGVMTFDVHPGALIPGRAQPLLNTPSERDSLLRAFPGIEKVITVTFDERMMRMPWREFIDYTAGLGAAHLVAGHDYRFGHRGRGDAEMLAAACADAGLGCCIIPPVEVDGVTVSSTHIRGLVASGGVERAARFLGRPHFITGTVGRGRGVGAGLGAPTVNLPLPEGVQPPAYGVYFTRVHTRGGVYDAVTNVGVRPTFDDAGPRAVVESALFGFSGDLYGQETRVEFLRRHRPERRFENAEALSRQIKSDIEAAGKFFQK